MPPQYHLALTWCHTLNQCYTEMMLAAPQPGPCCCVSAMICLSSLVPVSLPHCSHLHAVLHVCYVDCINLLYQLAITLQQISISSHKFRKSLIAIDWGGYSGTGESMFLGGFLVYPRCCCQGFFQFCFWI